MWIMIKIYIYAHFLLPNLKNAMNYLHVQEYHNDQDNEESIKECSKIINYKQKNGRYFR